jgi:GDP-L-fucose synthase
MEQNSRIFVAGHRGLVGSALHRYLIANGYIDLIVRTSDELDLRDRNAVFRFFSEERPEYVLLAAAKVGGILANDTYPAMFISDNLAIQSSVIEASHEFGVNRLLFLGSSCIYPKMCPQPMREEYLLTGPLEPTNRPYAVAKIAGIEMCWSFNRQYGTRYLAAMPTNLYGPEDNYDLANSHVLPALMRKVAEAKASNQDKIVVWGSGTPRREFLHSDDLAEACVFLMNLGDSKFDGLLSKEAAPLVNIGAGVDLTIRELAQKICQVFEFNGELEFDSSKPDGTPRKLMDSSLINGLGWRAKITLEEGIRRIYEQKFVAQRV